MRNLQTFLTGNLLGHFLRDERGSTAIEYALVASGVSIVIVGTVTTVGNSVKEFYSGGAHALKGCPGGIAGAGDGLVLRPARPAKAGTQKPERDGGFPA